VNKKSKFPFHNLDEKNSWSTHIEKTSVGLCRRGWCRACPGGQGEGRASLGTPGCGRVLDAGSGDSWTSRWEGHRVSPGRREGRVLGESCTPGWAGVPRVLTWGRAGPSGVSARAPLSRSAMRALLAGDGCGNRGDAREGMEAAPWLLVARALEPT
jgi:hypothetical protein